VIDTFKKVFVATYSSKDNFGPARAEAIVSNAIKRVLEPDTMTTVPQDPDEEGVCKAFEGILVQSQGPPRQATPSQTAPVPQTPPIAASTVANAAVTAATTARAPMAPGAKSYTPPTGPAAVYRPPQPLPSPSTSMAQPHSRSHTPVGPPLARTAPPQNQTQVPRSAEANLMGMLMGAPGKGSPSAATATPPTNSLITAANAIARNQTNAARVSAPVTASVAPPINAPRITTPSTIPHTAPPINATVPASPMMSASASKPSMLATAPVPTANMGQLSQKLNGIAEMRANGTSTPSRPAVEPLTPPPGAAPVLNVPSTAQTGMKRGPSPEAEAQEVKKAKVEVGGGD